MTHNKALKFDPDNLKAKFRMCKAHIELSEYTKAQEIINEVLEKQPKNTDFANLRKDLNNAVSFKPYLVVDIRE